MGKELIAWTEGHFTERQKKRIEGKYEKYEGPIIRSAHMGKGKNGTSS